MPKIPTTQPLTAAQVKNRIDRMGVIKAKMAELNQEYEELKDQLCAADIEEAEGRLFKYKRALVVTKKVDYKAVVDLYDIPRSVIRSHTTSNSFYRVNVTSR